MGQQFCFAGCYVGFGKAFGGKASHRRSGLYVGGVEDKNFASDLTEAKEKAWFACGMYFEHDWTADGPHVTRKQRADWEKKTAAIFISYVDTLCTRSLKRMGELIAKPSADECFYVFNPLSWTRTDYSDYLYSGPSAIAVVDKATGKEVPVQFVKKTTRLTCVFGQRMYPRLVTKPTK